MDDFPSLAEVDRIAALGDPIARNLQITQGYHELSLVVARRTGPYANWCTFATWASKQAGQTIRHEDLTRALENGLTSAPNTALAVGNVAAAVQQLGARQDSAEIRRRVWVALDPIAAVARTAAAVARGNQKVFAEIGREFARFAGTCLNDTAFEPASLATFCASLRPGGPPEGQDYLRQGFTHYYQALFETEPKTRAELLLLADLEIGLHEQTRLQPEIAEALDAALFDPDQFALRLIAAVSPFGGWPTYALLVALRRLKRRTPLDIAIEDLTAAARQQIRLLLTEHMMTLDFPNGVRLRLGDDLRAAFPPVFREITNSDLRAFLARHDPTPDSLRDTGVVDWANLPDRMHFITDLFRCYGQAADLLDPPFIPAQVGAIKAGRLPGGSL